jgi:hypothetical protein
MAIDPKIQQKHASGQDHEQVHRSPILMIYLPNILLNVTLPLLYMHTCLPAAKLIRAS